MLNDLIADSYLQFSVGMILLTTILLAAVSRGRLWQFGIILPMGRGWWLNLPVVVAGAFAGGAWGPLVPKSYDASYIVQLLLTVTLLAFASEYLFRGLIHGILARKSRILTCNSKFFVSRPNMVTAFLYAASLILLPFFHAQAFNLFSMTLAQGSILLTAFVFGLFLGFARERSHSFFSSFLIHLLAIFSVIFLPDLFTSIAHFLHQWWPAIGF